MAPDLCTGFTTKETDPSGRPRRYRVTGWVRLHEVKFDPANIVHQVVLEDYAEQGIKPPYYRMVRCARDEAQGVMGYGVSGGVFHLSEITPDPDGRCLLPEEHAADERELAERCRGELLDIEVNAPAIQWFVACGSHA